MQILEMARLERRMKQEVHDRICAQDPVTVEGDLDHWKAVLFSRQQRSEKYMLAQKRKKELQDRIKVREDGKRAFQRLLSLRLPIVDDLADIHKLPMYADSYINQTANANVDKKLLHIYYFLSTRYFSARMRGNALEVTHPKVPEEYLLIAIEDNAPSLSPSPLLSKLLPGMVPGESDPLVWVCYLANYPTVTPGCVDKSDRLLQRLQDRFLNAGFITRLVQGIDREDGESWRGSVDEEVKVRVSRGDKAILLKLSLEAYRDNGVAVWKGDQPQHQHELAKMTTNIPPLGNFEECLALCTHELIQHGLL